MLLHSSLFLKFSVLCWDAQKLNNIEVGNLKILFLLCADAYLDNTTGCFYNFRIITRKLNSVCCNYVNFSHQSLFLQIFFLPVYSAIIITYQLTIICSYQPRCCVKKLLRFLNTIIAEGRTD